MGEYEYVTMDKTRKIYIPAAYEKRFKGKRFVVLTMPDGDIILHPIRHSKNPLDDFRQAMGPARGTLKRIKREILETAMEGV